MTARTVRQVRRRWPPTFHSSAASSYAVGVLSPLISPSKALSPEMTGSTTLPTHLFLCLSAGLDRINTDAVGASLTGTSSWPVVAHGIPRPLSCGKPAGYPAPGWTLPFHCWRTLKYSERAVPESALSAPLSRRGSSIPNQLARRTDDDDVWPCDNHEFPSVDGHTSRLFLHPAVSVTRHGFSCTQPSATSLSSVLFVQEPALKLLPPDTRHLYSSQAGLQRRSSWPAHMSFRSSFKCSIINCSVFCFHREFHFWHQFVTSVHCCVRNYSACFHCYRPITLRPSSIVVALLMLPNQGNLIHVTVCMYKLSS
jgi:hypothetical protein